MKSATEPRRRSATRATFATRAALATAVLAALAACATPARDSVPDALVPGSDEVPLRLLGARGVQIYECRATASGHAWTFVAPEAVLLDARGEAVGQHGAGPHWQARDGSTVFAALRARADAPVPNAIPWLLLSVKGHSGRGEFARVSSIQRIHTAGGLAPATGCSAETLGLTLRVPYSADYRLFTRASAPAMP